MTTTVAPSACPSVADSPLLTHLYAELPRIELKGINFSTHPEPHLSPEQHEQILKEHVWKQCQDQLLQGLRVELVAAKPTNCSPKTTVPLASSSSTSTTSTTTSSRTSIHSAVLANTVHNNLHAAVVKTKADPTAMISSPLFQPWRPEGHNKIAPLPLQPCCSCHEKLQKMELANAQLTHAHQQAVRRGSAQLRHFACASHELRTPLNCIIGLASLLQTTELNPLQAESMQLISSSSELLLRTVNDVLDYSKLESGHVDVTLKPANLQETLTSVVQAMELKHQNSSIKVRTHYAAQLPPTWTTDRLRLQQILFNLIGNAYKFSPAGSCVDLTVEIGTPGQPSVPSHVTQPLTAPCVLRFVVKDYGCGIAAPALKQIFQPFVQAGEDTAKSYEGTGLGLAITAKLVQALGGCVYAHSTINVGSEFVVEFPFEETAIFDVQSLGERLAKANATCLVVPGPNLPQPAVLRQLLESYQVPYRMLDSMEDLDRIRLHHQQQLRHDLSESDFSMASSLMDESIQSLNLNGDTILLPADQTTVVCLIDEAVYQRNVMQRFQQEVEHADAASLLWTFGPEYTVTESSHHLRNLLQMVPSVLMQSMAEAVEEVAPQFPTSLTGGSKQRRHTETRHSKKKKKLAQASTSTTPTLPATTTTTMAKEDVSILVVDDNVVNQKVLRALLKKLGYTRVTVVGDGQKAVDAVANDVYHVVLMDVLMPVMDGLEATRIIVGRQPSEQQQQPKIVFVTASVDRELEEEAKELGAVGFVPKPFNLQQLDTCMTEICRSLP